MGRDMFMTPRNASFICTSGLEEHWELPNGTKKLQVRLSTEQPDNPEAHKFHCNGFDNNPATSINIDPLEGEEWQERWHDTYMAFDTFLSRYIRKTGRRDGWIDIFILT